MKEQPVAARISSTDDTPSANSIKFKPLFDLMRKGRKRREERREKREERREKREERREKREERREKKKKRKKERKEERTCLDEHQKHKDQ